MLKLFLSYFASALPQEYYYDYYSQIRLCAPAEPLPTPRHPSTRKTSTRQQANQAAAAAAAAAERASGSLENTLINNTLLGRDMTVCLAAIWVADCLLTELKSGQLQRKNIERYISFACAGGRAHEHSNEHPHTAKRRPAVLRWRPATAPRSRCTCPPTREPGPCSSRPPTPPVRPLFKSPDLLLLKTQRQHHQLSMLLLWNLALIMRAKLLPKFASRGHNSCMLRRRPRPFVADGGRQHGALGRHSNGDLAVWQIS